MPVPGPTPAEVARTAPFFAQADADCDGAIGLSEGAAFFKMSGLPQSNLKVIWALVADTGSRHQLSREQFCVAFQLIELALANGGAQCAITRELLPVVQPQPPPPPPLQTQLQQMQEPAPPLPEYSVGQSVIYDDRASGTSYPVRVAHIERAVALGESPFYTIVLPNATERQTEVHRLRPVSADDAASMSLIPESPRPGQMGLGGNDGPFSPGPESLSPSPVGSAGLQLTFEPEPEREPDAFDPFAPSPRTSFAANTPGVDISFDTASPATSVSVASAGDDDGSDPFAAVNGGGGAFGDAFGEDPFAAPSPTAADVEDTPGTVPICSICFAESCMPGEREVTQTLCGHIFCTQCLVAASKVNPLCPNCRAPLKAPREAGPPVPTSLAADRRLQAFRNRRGGSAEPPPAAQFGPGDDMFGSADDDPFASASAPAIAPRPELDSTRITNADRRLQEFRNRHNPQPVQTSEQQQAAPVISNATVQLDVGSDPFAADGPSNTGDADPFGDDGDPFGDGGGFGGADFEPTPAPAPAPVPNGDYGSPTSAAAGGSMGSATSFFDQFRDVDDTSLTADALRTEQSPSRRMAAAQVSVLLARTEKGFGMSIGVRARATPPRLVFRRCL